MNPRPKNAEPPRRTDSNFPSELIAIKKITPSVKVKKDMYSNTEVNWVFVIFFYRSHLSKFNLKTTDLRPLFSDQYKKLRRVLLFMFAQKQLQLNVL